MPTSVLYLVVGPNGAGKTTFFEEILGPATGLPFINADVIAHERWPGEESARAYEAAPARGRWLARSPSSGTPRGFNDKAQDNALGKGAAMPNPKGVEYI